MRNQVRKSLKVYDIKRISQSEFIRIALPIYNAALASYKVKAKQVTMEQIISSAQGDNKHFWAAYHKGTHEAVAVGLNTIMPDCCCYNVLKAIPKAMHNSTYPYYGLIHEMNRYYLNELNLDYVSDGARSLTEHSNIQPFLEQKFHFRKAYCKLNLVYKPWLGAVVNLLYPFRRFMPLKVKSILNLEAMYRGEY